MITEKDHQIIVSELLPMSEAPEDDTPILVLKKCHAKFDIAQRYGFTHTWTDSWTVGSGGNLINCAPWDLSGFIPMPIYQPNKPDESNNWLDKGEAHT